MRAGGLGLLLLVIAASVRADAPGLFGIGPPVVAPQWCYMGDTFVQCPPDVTLGGCVTLFEGSSFGADAVQICVPDTGLAQTMVHVTNADGSFKPGSIHSGPCAGQVGAYDANGVFGCPTPATTTTVTTSTTVSTSSTVPGATTSTSSTVTTTTSSTSTTTSIPGGGTPAPDWSVAPMIAAWTLDQGATTKTNDGPCNGTSTNCDLSSFVTVTGGVASACTNDSSSCIDTTSGHFAEGTGAFGATSASHTQTQYAACVYASGCTPVRDQVSAFHFAAWVRMTDDATTEFIARSDFSSSVSGGWELSRSANGSPKHALNFQLSGASTTVILQSSIEVPTRCAGGSAVGKVCSVDADCPSSTCSTHDLTHVGIRYHASPTPTMSIVVNGTDALSATAVCDAGASFQPRKPCSASSECHACTAGSNIGTACPLGTECTGTGATCGGGTCVAVPALAAPNGSAFVLGNGIVTNALDGNVDDPTISSIDIRTTSACRLARCGRKGTHCICSGSAYKACSSDGDCGGAGKCDTGTGDCRGDLVGTCSGGTSAGKPCRASGDCPSGTCVACSMPATCNTTAIN